MDSAPVTILSSPLSSPADTCMSFCSFGSVDHESSVLAMAILAGDIAEVISLINVGVTLSEHYHWTLYQACMQGEDMVRILLGSNCNQIIPVNDHFILHYVLRTPSARFPGGKADIVSALLEYGTNPFGQDRLGENALHILAGIPEDVELDLLRVLLAVDGPRPWLEARNHYGDTALVTAVLSQNHSAARMLLEVGADPNAQGEFGSTAAECASRRHDADMVVLLAEFGAELVDEDE